MSNTDKALWFLRIYGPCTNRELAARSGLTCDQTYHATFWLRSRGQVSLGAMGYSLTRRGRERIKQLELQPQLF